MNFSQYVQCRRVKNSFVARRVLSSFFIYIIFYAIVILLETHENVRLLLRDAFVTTNRPAVGVMFVRLSVCLSVRLSGTGVH